MNDGPDFLPATDLPRFVRELMEFVDLGAADLAAIRRTAPVVLEHEPVLTRDVYDHFLRFPSTAQFFLQADGTPDTERLQRRRHSLGRWLRQTAEAAMTHEFVYSLLTIGLSHSHRTHGPGGSVPPHFMVGAMSLLQTSLARLFQRELGEPREALEAAVAWNKLLLVHLNVLLLGYLSRRSPTRPSASA